MAGIKAFKKVGNADESTSKLQDRLEEFFAQFASNPLLDGVLLTNVKLDTTNAQIEHKLRRAPLGYIIVSQSANAIIWKTSNDLETSYLNLQASAPVTVSIWVF